MDNNKDKLFKALEDGELVDINPEYVYLTIPAKYVCVYHKLLVYMADFGKAIIDDCTASCKGNGKNIISCWNMFQSAVACYTLGKIEEADFFVEYIKKQLELIYRGSGNEVYDSTVVLPVDEEGKLYSIVSCGKAPRFRIDYESGQLLQITDENTDTRDTYALGEEDYKHE